MIKVREFPKENYKGIFFNGKTMRLQYDTSKPISELTYPEFMDVAINNKCYGACSYCYIEAVHTGKNYESVPQKINDYFGSLTENQRPFQVAIGGAGEPTLHPEFPEILKAFYDLGIMPNYTTNGMHLTDNVLDATVKYSGGVALTCHEHLEKHWVRGVDTLLERGIRTNLHIIISDEQSVRRFVDIYDEFRGRVEYFVLLPYQPVGFAKEVNTAFDYLFAELKEAGDIQDIAFGALFHPELVNRPWVDVSLYEPEIMSKYLDMDEMILSNSSFDREPIRKVL